MDWLQVLGVTPRWELALSFQVEEAERPQRLRGEELGQVLVRHRRSSCVRGWIEVKKALAELMQLVAVTVLGEEDYLQGKVALDLLIQVVQEAAKVSPHHFSTSVLDQADLAPTSPLTQSSLSSPCPLKAEVDLVVVPVLTLLVEIVRLREGRADLQGTISRFRRRQCARLEVRLVPQAVGYLVEEDWTDCSKKLGWTQSVAVEDVAARLGKSSFQLQPTQLIRFLLADFSSMDCSIRSDYSAALADDKARALVPMGSIAPRLNNCCPRTTSLAVLTHFLSDQV
jgi:hypothetical protein